MAFEPDGRWRFRGVVAELDTGAACRIMQSRMLRSGFTLIELIIVIAILALVAATVFVAIDPAKQLHKARNSTRWSDVTSILEGVKQYEFEHDGALPAIDNDPSTVQIVGANVGQCASVTCADHTVTSSDCGVDLSQPLRPYMKDIPTDPQTGTPRNTRYYINVDQYGIIAVGACDAEGEEEGGGGEPPDIEVSR